MPRTEHSLHLDMSVVTDPIVADALPELLQEWRAKKRWGDISPRTKAFHWDILVSFLNHGRPPDIAGIDPAILSDLQDRDLLVLDGNAVSHAYPFSNRRMPHTVTINGVTNSTVCAIDAFGAPAMVGSEGQICLECAVCGHAILIEIGDKGLELKSGPDDVRIWAGIGETGNCAATSNCQSMLGFCSVAHLKVWRDKQPQPTRGFAFSPKQALQAGAALFRPFTN